MSNLPPVLDYGSKTLTTGKPMARGVAKMAKQPCTFEAARWLSRFMELNPAPTSLQPMLTTAVRALCSTCWGSTLRLNESNFNPEFNYPNLEKHNLDWGSHFRMT